MTLGDLIGRFSDDGAAAQALLAIDDLTLVADVRRAADAFDETAAEYAAGAVRRFARAAEGEDWLALMTALEKADDPGLSALRGMLAWSLRKDREGQGEKTCGCGSARHECAG